MAIKGTLAAELEKTARKIKKNNIKKKAENAKTKAASKRTSTENARHSNGKTVKVSGKTSGAGKKTATEKVRHTNSGTVKNTTYTPSLRDNYDSYVRRSHTIRKAKKDFNAYRNANARQAYGERENVKKERDAALDGKQKGQNANLAKQTHGLKGMQVTKEQDAPSAFLLGAGGVVNDFISLRNAQRDYNAEHPRRNSAAIYKGSTGIKGPSTGRDFLDDYQDYYKRKSEEWAADPASQTLLGQAFYGIGRFGAETVLGGGNPVGSTMIRTMGYTGNRYDEAREAGASVEDAQKAAVKYAVPMAIAESIGGPERLVGKMAKGGTSILKRALKSGASEAAEEALQYPWETYSKTFYGKDVPLYANGKDENGNYIDAVINPSAMKENAIVGGTVGALIGGFGGGVSKVNHDNAVASVDGRESAALKAAADDYRKGMIDGAQLRASASAVKAQAAAERIYIEKAYNNDAKAAGRANEAVRRGILTREEADIALGKRRAEITENTLRDAGVEQDTAKRIGNMSERLNVRVLTDETDDNIYGSYDSDSRTIYLNPRSEKPLEYIMAHEITHLMEGTEEYNAFISAATTFYGDRLPAVQQNLIDAYARRGVELDEGKTNNETAAYFVQDELFRDPGRVSAAVNRMSGNLWQRILQAFDNMIVRLKGTQDEIVLSDIRNQWIAAGRAGGNQQAVTMDGNNDSYSINIRDTDLNGKEERGHAQTAYDDAFNKGEVGMVDAIDSAFLNGDPGVTKNTLTDAEAQATANESLAGKDYRQAADDFIRKSNAAKGFLDRDDITGLKELVTEGITIYTEAVNAGDINTAMDMMNANSVLATEIGRGLQAYTQLRKMTPEGRLCHANAMMIREAKRTTGFDGVEIKRRVDSEVSASMENIVSDFISGESVEEPTAATGKQQKLIDRAEKKAAKDKEAMKAEDEAGTEDLFDDDLEETGNTLADNVKRRQRKKSEGKKKPKKKDSEKGELNIVAEAKRVIAKGIKDGEISVKDLVMNGDIDASAAKIVEYVDEKSDLSPEETVELIAAVSEELQWRASKYRERALDRVKKDMFSSGKDKKVEKRGRAIVDKLIEYNRIGALGDPYTGDMIYTYIGVPMMSEADARKILSLENLAAEVAENPDTEIYSPYLTEDQIYYLEEGKKYGSEYVANVLHQMSQNVALDNVQSNVWQKLRQRQITGMLLNAKTFLRNVTPNAVMAPINAVGDIGASLVDRVAARKTGVRTKGAGSIRTTAKSTKDAIGKAYIDYKLGVDTSGGNIGELSKRRHFSSDTRFGRTENRATDLMGFSLQLGDRSFEESYRNNSLESQMKLNGVDSPTKLMEEFAEIEALERTFKDDNAMTDAVQKIMRILNRGNDFGAGSILLPFVRTPVNLTRMVYYYTPITGTVQLARNYYNYKTAPEGDAKIRAQHKMVNDASKLIGGSILTAMVMALKAAGLIEIYGGEDDNDRDRMQYEQQVHGFQPYSIRIGDHYYNYGNLQPVGSMIAFAVDGYDSLHDAFMGDSLDVGFGWKIVNGLANAATSSFDQIYDQSFMKGVSDLFSGAGDGADIFKSVISLALSVPNQFNPALVQQLARVIDPYKRNTRGNLITQEINKTLNNIPGLSRLLPEQVDAYGNPIERYDGGVASDIFNSFINPITTTKRKDSDVASEIERLEELTGETLIPGTVKKSIEYGDENVPLSNKEQSELKKKIGSDIYASIEELIASDEYQKLSPDMKAKAVKNIRDSITDVHKAEFLNSKGKSKTLEGKNKAMAEAPEHGMSVAQYALYDTILSTKDSKEARAYKDSEGNEYTLSASSAKRLFIFNSGLSGEAMRYLIETEGLMDSENQKTYMKNAEAEGISNIDYMLAYTVAKVYEDIYEHDDAARLNATSDFIDSMNYNDDQKQTIYDGVYNKWAYHVDQNAERMDFTSDSRAISARSDAFNAVWNGTSKYLNYAASDLGWKDTDMISAYEWANDNKSGNKKADFEAAVDKLDISAKQKAALVAARGFKPGSYKDGGSVSMDTVLKENPATGATFNEISSMLGNVNAPGSYNLATAEEKSRRDSRKALDEWSGNTGVVFPVGTGDYRFSGAFGEDRKTHKHAGIDISTKGASGIAALSVMDGEVVYRNTKGGYGNTIIIRNDDGYYCLYGHLNSYASNLKPGDRVKAGQQIGVVGSTGNSTGNHLHFEVRRESENGPAVDPNTVYDIDGDGVLSGGGNQKMSTGSSDPNYTASSYSGGSSSSGSSGSYSGGSSGSSSGSSSGTIARSVARRRRRIGSGSAYGYSGYSGYTGY